MTHNPRIHARALRLAKQGRFYEAGVLLALAGEVVREFDNDG